MSTPTRQQLEQQISDAGRINSTATVLFHNAANARLGLSLTDGKTVELIARLGPQTAGQIAEHTQLTTPSVTALIDRLEKKGFVRRVRDPHDRRKVIVEAIPERVAEGSEQFAVLAQKVSELCAHYSDGELLIILDFLQRGAQMMQEAAQELKQEL